LLPSVRRAGRSADPWEGWSSLRDFPHDFLWGASTSAHQVEGGNIYSDWHLWERQPGTQAVEPSGDAIDHFHRYDEDFALLASLGHNAHRFSLEWSRLEPTEGQFDEAALQHYERVLGSLDAHGLTPVVTLHHKTLPQWFAARGGWRSEGAVETFTRYVSRVAERYAGRMPWVCTINEPQIQAVFSHLFGLFPPNLTDPTTAASVNGVLLAAHRSAVAAVRAADPTARAGVCLQLAPFSPLRPDDADDIAATALMQRLMTDDYLEDLASGGDVGDFVGVQYYTRARIDARLPTLIAPPRPGTETTQMGWEVHPEGLAEVLRAATSTGLPALITENGIATDDDRQRVSFLARHLAAVRDVMSSGVPVLGYLHWSAFDNFEWNHGYAPRFGLVQVDRADGLRRTPRPSAHAYARLCRSGRLDALEPVTEDVAS